MGSRLATVVSSTSKSPALVSWSGFEVTQQMADSGCTPGPHILLVHDHVGLGSHREHWSRRKTSAHLQGEAQLPEISYFFQQKAGVLLR